MTAVAEPRPVVVAPFANERLREWPTHHYRRLIELIRREHKAPVIIVGTRPQRIRGNEIVRSFPAPDVANTCGQLSWDQIVALVDGAAYVVSNNSGIAHLAADGGVWTLCLFSGSHSFVEWMARGPRIVTMTRMTLCSPCDNRGEQCPNRHACLVDLDPETVFQVFQEEMRRGSPPL